jgi:hypothetical protein
MVFGFHCYFFCGLCSLKEWSQFDLGGIMKNSLFFLCIMSWFVTVHADVHQVTNTHDSGPGSLRQAILDANSDVNPPRSILFDIAYDRHKVVAIELETHLPALTVELTFDQEPSWYQFGIENMTLILLYAVMNA